MRQKSSLVFVSHFKNKIWHPPTNKSASVGVAGSSPKCQGTWEKSPTWALGRRQTDFSTSYGNHGRLWTSSSPFCCGPGVPAKPCMVVTSGQENLCGSSGLQKRNPSTPLEKENQLTKEFWCSGVARRKTSTGLKDSLVTPGTGERASERAPAPQLCRIWWGSFLPHSVQGPEVRAPQLSGGSR